MTVGDVHKKVRAIRAFITDDERAHGLEDDLYCDLLEAISEGKCEFPTACAPAALGTQKLQFARWRA